MVNYKEELKKRYNQQQQLSNLRNKQNKFGLGDVANAGMKLAGGVKKGLDIYNKMQTPQVPTANIPTGDLGVNYVLNTQPLQTPQGELASKLTEGSKVFNQGASQVGNASKLANGAGKALGAVGAVTGGLNAANKIANGDYLNGGIDAATTAIGLVNPALGAGLAVAKGIYDMFAGDQEKEQQERMRESQQGVANKQQETSEYQNDIENNKQKHKQELLEGYKGQLPDLNQGTDTINESLPQEGVNIPNEVETPQNEPSIIPQNQSLKDNVLSYFKGDTTGQAANIANNYLEEAMAGASPEEMEMAQNVMNGNEAEPMPTYEQPRTPAIDKLKSGLIDLYNGYQDNAKHSFTEGDVYKNIMGNEQEVGTTEDGILTGGAANTKKTIMNMVGEALGTGSRVMANPWTQAAIAGIATKATGGDGADVLNNMYKYGINKAKSNYYAKQMDQPITALSNYTADDYKASTKYLNDKTRNEISYLNALTNKSRAESYGKSVDNNYEIGKEKNNISRDKLKADTEYKNKMANIAQQRVSVMQQNANTQAGRLELDKAYKQFKMNNPQDVKPQNMPYYNEALAEYSSIINDNTIDDASVLKAQQNFIRRYGVDPNKLIKM